MGIGRVPTHYDDGRWNAITQRNRQARRMMILVEVMKMLLVVGVEGMWSRVTFQSDLGQAGHRGHRPPILPDKILNTQHTRRPAKITRRATEKNKQNLSSPCVLSGLCFYSFTENALKSTQTKQFALITTYSFSASVQSFTKSLSSCTKQCFSPIICTFFFYKCFTAQKIHKYDSQFGRVVSAK